MNYSDIEVDNDITSPQPQQEQQNTDQSPSSSAQATPLGSKGHSTWKCGVKPNKQQQKTSNEPKKNAKGKRRGPNSSQQQQAVNPSHSSSSSSPSSATPKNQKKKKGSKGSSPPRPDPFSPGTNTSSLKVFDPTSGLQFAWNYFRKLSKDEPKTAAPPKQIPSYQVLTAVQDVMWFKMSMRKQPVMQTGIKIWKSMALKCLRGLGRL